jgi:hypothetical protein
MSSILIHFIPCKLALEIYKIVYLGAGGIIFVLSISGGGGLFTCVGFGKSKTSLSRSIPLYG